MFAARPVFGIGIGRYSLDSEEFSTSALPSFLRRENAHNNFLQILAELGFVGFAAFAWLLLAVGHRIWRARTEGGLSPPALGAAAGLIAFLLTCLVGHPLLIPEVAYAFWLVLGLATVLVPDAPPTANAMQVRGSWPLRSVVTGSVAVLLVVSVPLRARQMIAQANVGSASVGLSDWLTDSEGTSFRWMDEYAQFSIRANVRVVGLPLRLSARQEGAAREVEIYVDGLLLGRIELEGSEWHEFRVVMPPAPLGVDFRRIELRARRDEAATPGRAGAAAPPRIEVGRPNLTRPVG
jgi:hypothetical protein